MTLFSYNKLSHIVIILALCVSGPCLSREALSIDLQLLKTLKNNEITAYKELLEVGANPNSIDGAGEDEWVMCLSAQHDDIRYLELALKFKGNPVLVNDGAVGWWSTPLNCAANEGNTEAVRLLMKAGASPNRPNCWNCEWNAESPYHSAILLANYSTLYEMLKLEPIEPQYVPPVKLIIEEYRLDPKGEKFKWRARVAQHLRDLGYEINR